MTDSKIQFRKRFFSFRKPRCKILVSSLQYFTRFFFYPWLEFVRSAVLLIRSLTPSLPHGAAVVRSFASAQQDFNKRSSSLFTLLLLLGSWKLSSHLTHCSLVAIAPCDPSSLNMLRHAKKFCLDLVLVSCNVVLSLDSTHSVLHFVWAFLSFVNNNCQNDYCWILLPKCQKGLFL